MVTLLGLGGPVAVILVETVFRYEAEAALLLNSKTVGRTVVGLDRSRNFGNATWPHVLRTFTAEVR